jgi:DNA processing protein
MIEMTTAKEAPTSPLTVEGLLGRQLNDVEKKNVVSNKFYVSGNMTVPLSTPRVSIVGSRKASSEGLSDARGITKILVERGVTIVSGLAEGIDTAAHEAAIEAGGKTIAVLGTPLNKTYPRRNFNLQQEIMHHHLAISQFQIGHHITPKDFVARNRTMALISDATIIVEAMDTSGSLHQGWEALRLGRPLFIWKTIFNNTRLTWPEKMRRYGAIELSEPTDVFESLPSSIEMLNIFQ